MIEPRGERTPPPRPSARDPRGVAALFVVLIAGLCARPLASETFIDSQLSFLSGLEVTSSGPQPAATAALDGLLLMAAAIAFVLPSGREGLPAGRLRRGWRWAFALGVAGLGVAIVLSCAYASDKRAALNASGNIVALVLVGAAAYRLLRSPWMARLALAAMLASGGTLAMKCILQVTGEYAEAREFWETEQRPKLEKSGVDLTAPTIINYERRLNSNEAIGFLTLSNLAASCLMMFMFPACGLLAGSFRRRAGGGPPAAELWAVRGVLALLIAGFAAALWSTGSSGAFVGTASGFMLFAVCIWQSNVLARRAVLVMLAGAGLYFGGLAAVAAYGAAQGTLPHASLAFRWHYWSTVPAAVSDGWPVGLGRENFQAAYLRHKPAVSPEETRDPHNLWLTLLIELGPIGLAAGCLLIGSVVLAALRGLRAPSGVDEDATAAPPERLYGPSVIGCAVAFLLLHGCLSGAYFSGPDHFLAWLIQVCSVWLLCFAVFCGLLRPATYGGLDSRWLGAAIVAGLGAALVHATVDFALVTPAGLAVFVWLAVLGARQYETVTESAVTPPARSSAIVPTAVLMVFAMHFAFVIRPAIRVANARDALYGRLQAATRFEDAEAAVREAAGAMASDRMGDGLARLLSSAARQLARTPELPAERQVAWLERGRDWADEARRRNPRGLGPIQDLAGTYSALAEAYALQDRPADEAAALRSAAQANEAAVTAYPTNSRLRIAAGVAWYECWRMSRLAEDAERANAHLRAALDLDALRPPEEVVRLRESERATIDDHLGWIKAALQPASTRAAGE